MLATGLVYMYVFRPVIFKISIAISFHQQSRDFSSATGKTTEPWVNVLCAGHVPSESSHDYRVLRAHYQ